MGRCRELFCLDHVTDQPQGSAYLDPSKAVSWLAAVVLCLLFSIGQAWGATGAEEKKTIVAAGFGYQIGTVSTIAVKVYDAESGVILSDEVYELSVKESDGVRSSRGPRIFAGGVGRGATDLSNFVLRVYDANTGVFQWEGRLNLVQPDGKAEGKFIDQRHGKQSSRRCRLLKRLSRSRCFCCVPHRRPCCVGG